MPKGPFHSLRGFVHRNLDPGDRLGEAMFGIIMALAILGATRVGLDEADNRTLAVAILGCNIAWAIVDGVMYATLAYLERCRVHRFVSRLAAEPDPGRRTAMVGEALDEQFGEFLGGEDREIVFGRLAAAAVRRPPAPARLKVGDVAGGCAAAIVIFGLTVPVVAPFLLIEDTWLAVQAARGVAIAFLFGLGASWGRSAGANGLLSGLGLTAIGLVLVALTVALGG